MKKLSCFLLALLLTLTPLLGNIVLPAAAAEEPEQLTDLPYAYTPGLKVWYDGVNNTGNGHDDAAKTWADRISGLDMTLSTNDKNHFTSEGFALDSSKQSFPQGVVDIVNGTSFTVEILLGEFVSLGANYNTFMNSSNDNFALFRQVDGDNLQLKWAAKVAAERPQTSGALSKLQNALVTISYEVDGKVALYLNGVLADEKDCTARMGANDLFIGQVDSKAFSTVYKSIRFYDRALSAEEVKRNAVVDGYGKVQDLYVADGLVALFSGISNTKDGYKADAEAWENLVGEDSIKIAQSETNYFTPEGFHNDVKQYYFPQSVVDTINGKSFTVEMSLGDIISKGTGYNTFLNSQNDSFSLYRMTSDDTLYLKAANNAAADRARAAEGMLLTENSLITITYEVGGKAIIYSNGVQVAEAKANAAMGANNFFLGHEHTAKSFATVYRSLRFYDRVLTAEEVKANAKADGVVKADLPLSPGYVSIAQPTTNIVGDVALVRRVDSLNELNAVMSAEVKPAAVIVTLNKDLKLLNASGEVITDLATLMETLNYTVMPVFELVDADVIDPLVTYLKTIRFADCFFMSKDVSVVKKARTTMPTVRGVIDYTEAYKDKDSLTKEECDQLRKSMKSNEGTVALLPQSVARQETVQYLYDSIVNVWVQQDVAGTAGHYDALLSGAVGVVSDDTAELYAAATALPENTMTRVPLNIGHRGLIVGNYKCPENTIEGALIAHERGANVIELDVYITTDGHVVVMHDPTTGRTCDKDLNVANSTLAQLKELYVNRGFESDNEKNTWRIPTLDEFLEAFKGLDCRLFIEIKSEDKRLVPAVRDLVNKHDMYDQCAVITFSATHMSLMREQWPEMSVGALYMSGKMTENNPDLDMRDVMAAIGKYNATLNTQNFGFGQKALRAALIRGIGVYPWTLVNNNPSYTDYLQWGYSGLTGNTPDYLGNFIKKLTLTGVQSGDSFEVGDSVTLAVSTTTYDKSTADVSAKASIVFVEGADLVKLEGTTLTFTGSGDVTFYITNEATVRRSQQILGLQAVTLHIAGDETEPATEPSTEPATEPTTTPATEPATTPATEPATTPATEPVTEPTTEPATTPATTPATETSTETSTEAEESGCASSLSGGVLLAALPVALLLRKRKKED